MNTFVAIPNIGAYYDRLSMFCELGKLSSRSNIYIRQKTLSHQPFSRRYPDVHFNEYNGKSNIISKFISLKAQINALSKGTPCILHDLVEPYILMADKWFSIKRDKKFKHIVSLYYPSTKFYKEKGWKHLRFPVSNKEDFFYKRLFFKRFLLEKFTAKYADGIIGNSEEICESMRHYYKVPKEKLAVIPTAIDTARYRFVGSAKARLPGPIQKANKLLLYTGSLQPRKEIMLLIKTLAYIRSQSDKNIHLSLCGGIHVDSLKKYKDFALSLNIGGAVHFPGNQTFEQLSLFYSAADCFVFPSLWEGSPRSIKEALAFGCPVVAAHISGNRIIDNGQKLIHYARKQSESRYGDAILNVLDTHDYSDREKYAAHLNKYFAPAVIAQKTFDFYNKILNLPNTL